MKKTIVDDWKKQEEKFQIVDVRSPKDFKDAGHISHATNIPWVTIIDDSSLAKLDSNKAIILYCYYGQASMINAPILSLMGYRCRSLDFGMMGWNLEAMGKAPWDKQSDFPVEMSVNKPDSAYDFQVIMTNQTDLRKIIREAVWNYFHGDGSPVLTSTDVKEIVDNWEQKKANFQIVDIRPEIAYAKGHIPHAINIPLNKLAAADNLKKLDVKRKTILYSENGQTGLLASTTLNLLGYRSVAMKFGMMDWNRSYVDSTMIWNEAAAYPVEH